MGRMINPRRMRDCYDSTLPPTRPQFDRYLQDLSDWIQYIRHSLAGLYFRDLSDESLSDSYLPMLYPRITPHTVPEYTPMVPHSTPV